MATKRRSETKRAKPQRTRKQPKPNKMADRPPTATSRDAPPRGHDQPGETAKGTQADPSSRYTEG